LNDICFVALEELIKAENFQRKPEKTEKKEKRKPFHSPIPG
jgi:hypothetical protein